MACERDDRSVCVLSFSGARDGALYNTKRRRDGKKDRKKTGCGGARREIEVRGALKSRFRPIRGAPTFGLVLLGAAARLLRLRVYEIVIRMRADVLPHPQVIAVDLVCVRGVAERDRRQKDEQPAKKSRRMGHRASFYATSLRQPPHPGGTTIPRRRTNDILPSCFETSFRRAAARSDGTAADRHDRYLDRFLEAFHRG